MNEVRLYRPNGALGAQLRPVKPDDNPFSAQGDLALTWILVGLALVIVFIAFFAPTWLKAICCFYIVFPWKCKTMALQKYSFPASTTISGQVNVADSLDQSAAGSVSVNTATTNSIAILPGGSVTNSINAGSAVTLTTGSTIPTATHAYRVTAAGNITGLILAPQPGSALFRIINESAFTMTFAASGTSNVASGTSSVVGANSGNTYVYNTGTSLWYCTSDGA
jgi:hypothetical protein